MKIKSIVVATIAVAIASIVDAQTTAPSTRPVEVIRFVIHPAAATQPALHYPLLPPMTERRPGNAAVQYMIAANMLPPQPPVDDPKDKAWKIWNELDEQTVASTETFSPKVAADVVEHCSFRWIDTAARRDHADWDVDFRGTGLYALLPQLNYMRLMANLVTVRTRLDVSRGDWAAADQSLQSGFAMSWHLNDEPVTVQSLVACGISQLTLSQAVHDWISHGGPNLYWSLTNLPPTVDLPAVSDTEQAVIPLTDPLFQSALAGTLPPDQWRTTLERVLQRLSPDFSMDGHLGRDELSRRYGKLLVTIYPRAVGKMRSAGVSKAQIESMPHERAVGEFIFNEYHELSDKVWKGWTLPFVEAEPLLRSGRDALNRAKTLGNPLMTWVPDIYRCRVTLVRLDQHIATLRIVEAIRDYTAQHNGKLPANLADVTALPVPLDPVTGGSFAYQLDGSTAVLSPSSFTRSTAVRYELQMK